MPLFPVKPVVQFYLVYSMARLLVQIRRVDKGMVDSLFFAVNYGSRER